MREACSLVWSVLVLLFQPRASLGAEILILRHQLNIQRRHLPKRLTFSAMDRLIFVGLSRLAPSTLNALTIVKPETVVRWHRVGFRSYWRWKSRPRSGRPTVAVEIRRLIREMSIANPLWGAPRIHGELLKLGVDIGQTSVAKYMVKRRHPPSQGWRTFKDLAIGPVPVANEIAGSLFPPACFRDLICDPFSGWMRCDAKPQNMSPAVPHDQQSIGKSR